MDIADIKKIIRIYRANQSWGAVYLLSNGKKQASFFKRSALMALFVRTRFDKRTKTRHNLRVYLQKKIGVTQALTTMAYLDLKRNTLVSYKEDPTVWEMAETFELGFQVCK